MREARRGSAAKDAGEKWRPQKPEPDARAKSRPSRRAFASAQGRVHAPHLRKGRFDAERGGAQQAAKDAREGSRVVTTESSPENVTASSLTFLAS